jgi:hypothetical protein
MRGPGCPIGEETIRVLAQASDQRTGQSALAHIGQRLGIDGVIAMTRAQQFEEVPRFMTWIWLSTTVVLLGAELDAEMEYQTMRDTTTGPAKPRGRRGAQVADTVGPTSD